MSTTAKVCTKCGGVKPLAEFSRNRVAKDGLQFHCRVCAAAYTAKYRAANREKYAAAWAELVEWTRDTSDPATTAKRESEDD